MRASDNVTPFLRVILFISVMVGFLARPLGAAEVYIGNIAHLSVFDMGAGSFDSGEIGSPSPIFIEHSFPRASAFVMTGPGINHLRSDAPAWEWDGTHSLSENAGGGRSQWSDVFTINDPGSEGEAIFTFYLKGTVGGDADGMIFIFLNGDIDLGMFGGGLVQSRWGSVEIPIRPFAEIFRCRVPQRSGLRGYQTGVPFTLTASFNGSTPVCCGRFGHFDLVMALVDITLPPGATLVSQRGIRYPNLPIINARREGGNVVVQWPNTGIGYRLEKSELGSGVWQLVEGEFQLDGETYTFSQPIGEASAIFRLRY